MKTTNSTLFLLLFSLWLYQGFDARAEENQTVANIATRIESDKLILDKQKQTTTFIGNVHLSRKKLTMNADKIIVHQQKEQGSKKNKIAYMEAFGSPARFSDIDNEGKKISARANYIYYNHHTEQLKLEGDAKLQDDKDQFISQIIWYNRKTKAMQAGKIQSQNQQKSSRVKILLFENNEHE